MSIRHLKILQEEDYNEESLKKNSVSIEYIMRVDDCSKISPFRQMITIDNFRDLDPKDVEDKIMKDSEHIARTFYLALHHRKDCLDSGDK